MALDQRDLELYQRAAKTDTKAMMIARALPLDEDEFKQANERLNTNIDEMLGLGLMKDITADCPKQEVPPIRPFRIIQLTEQGIILFNEPKRGTKPN